MKAFNQVQQNKTALGISLFLKAAVLYGKVTPSASYTNQFRSFYFFLRKDLFQSEQKPV